MSRRCRPGWYLRRRGRAVVAGHRCDGVYLLVLSGQGSLRCASTVRCPIAAGENLRVVAAFSCSPKAALGACSHLLCANFAKKNGVACGSLRHTAPHGVTYLSIESSRTSRRLYGVCRVQTRGRGRTARATTAAGTQPKPRKLPKASLRLVYGSVMAVRLPRLREKEPGLGTSKAKSGGCEIEFGVAIGIEERCYS